MATVLIALTGCASSPPGVDTDSPAAAYVRTGDWGEGDAAQLEGRVVLEDGCLTVVGDAGHVTVPVFPTDFTWDGESESLAGFGHTFSVGDDVSLTGGYQDTPFADHLPSACEGRQYFTVHSA